MGTTTAGLRYPTPQDPVADTDLHIKNLAQDIDHRLGNQALQFGTMALTTNGGGDFIVTFPRLSTLQGLVIQPFVNGGGNGGDVWTLIPFVVGFAGNTAQVHVWYLPVNRTGYLPANFANAAFLYSVFGWGVPV